MEVDNDNGRVPAKAARGRPEDAPADSAVPDALKQDNRSPTRWILDDELEAFLDALPDLYVRLQSDGTVLSCRTSDEQNLSALPGQAAGKTLFGLLPAPSAKQMADAIQEVLRTHRPCQIEYTLPGACGDRTFEARLVRFGESELIAIIREITDRRRAELQPARLRQQLQSAGGNLTKLDALLPICSKCKRIRDERGGWQRLEKYLMEHSGLHFTHSLCPQCVQELYPDTFPAGECEAGQR
jgi:hypothetical protein